jgi:formylglycine-generating enzyme required for sulfatase activity
VLAKGNHSAESCAARGPLPVGSRPRGATPSGLVDMAGNVEEWVADWYADRHPDGRARDPRGPGWGNARVLRGGGWRSRPDEARVTARDWAAPSEAGPNVGFRCAAPG